MSASSEADIFRLRPGLRHAEPAEKLFSKSQEPFGGLPIRPFGLNFCWNPIGNRLDSTLAFRLPSLAPDNCVSLSSSAHHPEEDLMSDLVTSGPSAARRAAKRKAVPSGTNGK